MSATATTSIDFDATYSVDVYRGIAFYLVGWKKVWEPYTYLVTDEETGEEYEEESCEGEWIDDPQERTVIAVMVGDDRKHEIDVDDLTPLNDEDYCHECGQIGCQCTNL